MFFSFVFFIALFTCNIYASNQNDNDWKTEPGEIAKNNWANKDTKFADHTTATNLQSNNTEKADAASAAANDEQEELPLFFQFIQAYSVDGIEGQQPYKPGKTITDAVEALKKDKEKGKEKTIRNWFLQRAPKGGSDILKVFETFMGDELPEHQKKFLSVLTFASENNGALQAISDQPMISKSTFEQTTKKQFKNITFDRIIIARNNPITKQFLDYNNEFLSDTLKSFESHSKHLLLAEIALYNALNLRTFASSLLKALQNNFKKLTDINSKQAECFRRELSTDSKKVIHACMLLDQKTDLAFNRRCLNTPAEKRKEMENLLSAAVLAEPSLEYNKNIILALFDAEHSSKKGADLDTKDCSNAQDSLEKKIQEISGEAAATGNADAEEMLDNLDALDQTPEINEDSNSDEKLNDTSDNKKAETTQTVFADTDQVLTKPRKKVSKGILEIVHEFTERKSSNINSNSGCQDYQVVCSNKLEKSSEYAEVQANYKSAFEKLIEALKNGTKEGQPEALKGKTPDGLRQYSRRITSEHRLVYAYDHKNKKIHIVECGGHYGQ